MLNMNPEKMIWSLRVVLNLQRLVCSCVVSRKTSPGWCRASMGPPTSAATNLFAENPDAGFVEEPFGLLAAITNFMTPSEGSLGL